MVGAMRLPESLCCAALLTTACQPIEKQQDVSPSPAATAMISSDDTITVTGTEPFWGGTIGAGQFTYSTPENQPGETIAVKRFAGNNGLGFSGLLGGEPLDLTVTPGVCSDGMSDRSYPYTVTLRIGSDQREGCGWTARQPFSGSRQP